MGHVQNGGGYYHYSYSVVRGVTGLFPVDVYVLVVLRQLRLCYGIIPVAKKIKRTCNDRSLNRFSMAKQIGCSQPP